MAARKASSKTKANGGGGRARFHRDAIRRATLRAGRLFRFFIIRAKYRRRAAQALAYAVRGGRHSVFAAPLRRLIFASFYAIMRRGAARRSSLLRRRLTPTRGHA